MGQCTAVARTCCACIRCRKARISLSRCVHYAISPSRDPHHLLIPHPLVEVRTQVVVDSQRRPKYFDLLRDVRLTKFQSPCAFLPYRMSIHCSRSIFTSCTPDPLFAGMSLSPYQRPSAQSRFKNRINMATMRWHGSQNFGQELNGKCRVQCALGRCQIQRTALEGCIKNCVSWQK